MNPEWRLEWCLLCAQADAVLSMALRRLTSLEAGKLREEEATLAQTLAQLQSLLGSQQLVLDTVKRESQEIADKFGDSRRTAVRPAHRMPVMMDRSDVG